ncbi:two-component response regulator ORR25-like [Chenopodium quinoa]|uniref:Response regulatory domain-containing protein n=1 Tax=Chenopodium quinoa TaxID=63459 RepID=A0A803KV18_CHEQI|nr:two-component response regulator ORR25-like [Chenopodium quinoa]
MMQERANDFDLVIAAMDMLEMDGFTFLKIAKMVSDHPVVLTTYKKLDPLAFEAIERGACELCTKPIKREDAEYFWQYVFRKDRNKTQTDIRKTGKELPQNEQLTGISAGKGKEIATESPSSNLAVAVGASRHTENNQKRKRVQYGNEKTLNKDTETSTGRIQYKKIIRWNTGINTRFMEALMKGNEEAIVPAQPGPGIAYLAALAQKNKERGDHPTNVATPTSASDTIQVQGLSNSTNIATPTSATDTIQALPDASYAITNAQRSGNTPRQQPQNVISNATAIRQGYRFLQNHGLSLPSPRVLSGSGIGQQLYGAARLNLGNTNNVSQFGMLNRTSSMNKTSHLFNTSNQLAVNETTGNQSLLRGRIDQIRHAYLNNPGTENASSIPNLQTETAVFSPSSCNRTGSQSENISNGEVRCTGELVSRQTNVQGNNSFPNYGYNGSSIINPGSSPLLSSCAPYLNQFSNASSENYVESFMQNPSNLHSLQVETTGLLQTPDVPNFNSNNNSLLPSYGLDNQAIQPTNDLVGNILQDAGATGSTEEIPNTADPSRTYQLTDEDDIFEAFLAEINNDPGSDFSSLGFNTGNDA